MTAFFEILEEIIKPNLGNSPMLLINLTNKKLPLTVFPLLKTSSNSFLFLTLFFVFRATQFKKLG